MSRWRWTWTVWVALSAPACVRAAPGCDLSTPYDEAVQLWTAKAELYQNGDQRAAVAATLESPIFVEQRNRELSQTLGWSPSVEESERSEELAKVAGETSFVVGLYADVMRDNDLGSPHSLWRVALETPAGELLPIRIERLGRANDQLRKLYPYLDWYYSRVYRVHFPKVETAPVTLQIASALGTARLEFQRL